MSQEQMSAEQISKRIAQDYQYWHSACSDKYLEQEAEPTHVELIQQAITQATEAKDKEIERLEATITQIESEKSALIGRVNYYQRLYDDSQGGQS